MVVVLTPSSLTGSRPSGGRARYLPTPVPWFRINTCPDSSFRAPSWLAVTKRVEPLPDRLLPADLANARFRDQPSHPALEVGIALSRHHREEHLHPAVVQQVRKPVDQR